MPLDNKSADAAQVADTATGKKPELPAFYNDLALTLESAWRMLAQGATDRDAPLHVLSVANIDLAGNPQQRCMVLRECYRNERVLHFHTDLRSAKVAQFSAAPRLSMLGYDHGRRTQLRLSGETTILTEGALVDRAWQTMRNISRVAYRSRVAPGTHFASADDHEALTGEEITAHDAFARENFCVVRVSVHELEWVYLNAAGNRRAIFDWSGGMLHARWLQA